MRSTLILYCCLLGIVHGLRFIPTPPNPESTLITYNTRKPETSLHYRTELDKFWKNYFTPKGETSDIIVCEPGEPPIEGSKRFCYFDYHELAPCIPEYGYYYNRSTYGPCVFLEFPKITNWVPEYYNSSTIPSNMPESLKKHIRETEEVHGAESRELKKIWVSCEGDNPADAENIGVVGLYPSFAFDGKYFPVRNEEFYMSPLIAVWFERPQTGVQVSVTCKAWARNLEDQSAHFEFLVNEFL